MYNRYIEYKFNKLLNQINLLLNTTEFGEIKIKNLFGEKFGE